ncbi:hypothetical protein CISIN_1g040103mg [Citrus sinensis]|uniref:Malectin-like domain-containing protein n=1 Tax=Citrus sinensis TaxID=2711 RepID=A0A067DDB8_CITSI|nr:hypothetical protein CISIN_1g040103mg [Citrus sinensis]
MPIKTNDDITKWRTDQEFINVGKNFLLTPNQNINTMNILRFSPDGNKKCYKLPLSCAVCKFLFQARFFYGNYGGLSKPPSFR